LDLCHRHCVNYVSDSHRGQRSVFWFDWRSFSSNDVMTIAFVIVLVVLLLLGAYLRRLRQATLDWVSQIPVLAIFLHEIDEAKPTDPAKTAELLGRSVGKRGLQYAITPPWCTTLTMLHWVLGIGTYIWGFWGFRWYIAAFWPILFSIVKC